MWTKENSLNIEWHDYEFDGWCPGCDLCRDCGHAHEIGKGHYCGPEREMRPAINYMMQSRASENWEPPEHKGDLYEGIELEKFVSAAPSVIPWDPVSEIQQANRRKDERQYIQSLLGIPKLPKKKL